MAWKMACVSESPLWRRNALNSGPTSLRRVGLFDGAAMRIGRFAGRGCSATDTHVLIRFLCSSGGGEPTRPRADSSCSEAVAGANGLAQLVTYGGRRETRSAWVQGGSRSDGQTQSSFLLLAADDVAKAGSCRVRRTGVNLAFAAVVVVGRVGVDG